MPVDVKDGKVQRATIILEKNGKLRYSTSENATDNVHIGGTNAVGNGALNDLIGGQLSFNDVALMLRELTTGAGDSDRGNIAGISGVELLYLDDDSFSLSFSRTDGTTDIIDFVGEGLVDILAAQDGGADLGDGKSRFSIIDTGALTGPLGSGNAIIGTKVINDLIGGQLNKNSGDVLAILEAALSGEDDRISLLGLDESSFSVRVFNEAKGTTDTVLFKGEEVRSVIPNAVKGLDKLTVATILGNDTDATVPRENGGNTPVNNGTDRFAAFLDADGSGHWDAGEEREDLASYGNGNLMTNTDQSGGLVDIHTAPGNVAGNQFFLGVSSLRDAGDGLDGQESISFTLAGDRTALGAEVTIRGIQVANPQGGAPLSDIAAGTKFNVSLFNDSDGDGVIGVGELVETRTFEVTGATQSFTAFLTDDDLATFNAVQVQANQGQFTLDSLDFFYAGG